MEILRFARHLHTANHNQTPQKVSIGDLEKRYAQADAIVVEDHGHFQPPLIPESSDPGPMVMHGCEWATPLHLSNGTENRHHVGLMGVDSVEQSKLKIQGYDAPKLMQQKVHLADGALVLNHPEYPYIDKTLSSPKALDYTLPPEEAQAFDAVELFNDVGFHGSNPAEVLKWVEKVFYSRGLYPSMVGGQDDHGPSPVAKEPTYTMALVNDKTEAELMNAVRSGRTFVSKSLQTQVDVRSNGQSLWAHSATFSQSPQIFQTVLSGLPDGAVVEVVRQGEVIGRSIADAGESTLKLTISPPLSAEQPDYLYVRVWRKPGELHTVSSARPLQWTLPTNQGL